ncbi:MAG TPA: tripartite tricarboxylate transporter substrate binding protein [Xanthobacteraceae bacterium]|jgi:tripartite-type tricarboxylate transporter receptor subunit TctC|nr:tripartite tricarboxylate transporter substrate binding protein [Xanthobacteraceae bacterium]
MMSWRRSVVLGAIVLAAQTATAPAQDYPSRPVTIVVGYTPGATSDLLARTMAERLNAAWGQSVIVDNRSGVGGNIAAGYVARAPADGYTLMVGTDAIMTSNVFLYKNTPFDPVKDFAPITNAGANIICLTVHVDLPVNSVAELIAYAKANPGKLQYGSSGIGSPHHLAGELLRQKTGIDIVHVPYRGGGATINDLLGGHIKVAFLSLSSAVPHLGSGKIRIVAVVEKSRYAAMPNIPTIGETVPGFEMSSWLGFFAPAGTPLITRLNEAMVKVLTTDAVKEKLAALGLVVAPSTPAELAATVREGLAVRGELVKAANIQAE